MMPRRTTSLGDEGEARSDYWMTFSDLMAGLLMVFALLLSVTVLVSTQEYRRQIETIEEKDRAIEDQKREIDERKRIAEAEYRRQFETIEEKDQAIEDQKREIDERKRIAEQRLGIRQEIIDDLRRRLAGYDVQVDQQTGALMIAAAVLFDQNDATVKGAGKVVLNDVMQAYSEVLLGSERYKKYLSRIIVEGHTNDDGTYVHNLELSQRRAFNVMVHILDHFAGSAFEDDLKTYLVASGRSEMDLVYSTDGQVDKERSRRILVKFGLRDENVIDELRRIFEKPL